MKKKILAMTLLLAIMASMLVFAACKDDEPDEPKSCWAGFCRRIMRETLPYQAHISAVRMSRIDLFLTSMM